MKISLMQSITSILKKPKLVTKEVLTSKTRIVNQKINRAACLKIIINGEKSIDKLAETLKVNRLTIIRYLKFLREEGLITFLCNKTTKPEIIGAVKL